MSILPAVEFSAQILETSETLAIMGEKVASGQAPGQELGEFLAG